MYNLRYHIASLVAVFLALAIGLLLGTIVVERGMLDRQRTSIVQSLQTDFTGLKKDNNELRRDRDRANSFAEAAAPQLVTGMLQGKTVVVVTNAGRNDALAATRDALRAAGADSVIVTLKAKEFGVADPAVKRALTEAATGTPAREASPDALASALADEWMKRGEPQPVTEALRAAGQVSVESTNADIAADGVVLLAAFDSQADPSLVALAGAMHTLGTPAAAVESQAVSSGVADAAVGAGLSTVDAIDRPEGPVSLAYVLAGKAEGHFGVKSSATALFPKLR